MSRGWNPFLIRTRCRLFLKCYFPEEMWSRPPKNVNLFILNEFLYMGHPQNAKRNIISFLGTCHKWATSYEFLYMGHTTSEQIQMNFVTWYVPKVSHFIWISVLGAAPKCTNSYEFLYLGRAKKEPLHLNFCTWDTPQVKKIKWISLLGTCHKWATSFEFLYMGHPQNAKKNIISLLGTCHKWATSYEFLYMGHTTSEQIQMNFFTWYVPQVSHFIWISVLRAPRKCKNIHEFLDVGTRQWTSSCISCEFDRMFFQKSKI